MACQTRSQGEEGDPRTRQGRRKQDSGPTSAHPVELVWPGKGAAFSPAPSREEPDRLEAVVLHGSSGGGGSGSREGGGRLISGDNLSVARSLGAELEGKIDLLYLDPPFATGDDFSAALAVGENAPRSVRAARSSGVEGPAYCDRWVGGAAAYLDMLVPRLLAFRSLLSTHGSLFVHVDRRLAPYVRLVLDEIFGSDQLVNEIIWCYTGPSSPGMKGFANKHDVIFWYANGPRWTFNVDPVRLPYKESTLRNEGRRTGFTTGNPDLVVRLNPRGKFPEDWWMLPVEAPASVRRTGYPTQKPERLLERILLAASNPGDLVADFFCGSGTTLAVAERLGRRWLGCDSSDLAVHTSRKRILGLEGRGPFSVERLLPLQGRAPADPARVHLRWSEPREGLLPALELAGFELKDPEAVPSALRDRARHWSDWIDFVALSWEGKPGPLVPELVTYRSRSHRSLPLSFPGPRGARSGRQTPRMEVVDILGRSSWVNETMG